MKKSRDVLLRGIGFLLSMFSILNSLITGGLILQEDNKLYLYDGEMKETLPLSYGLFCKLKRLRLISINELSTATSSVYLITLNGQFRYYKEFNKRYGSQES